MTASEMREAVRRVLERAVRDALTSPGSRVTDIADALLDADEVQDMLAAISALNVEESEVERAMREFGEACYARRLYLEVDEAVWNEEHQFRLSCAEEDAYAALRAAAAKGRGEGQ